MLFGSIFEVFEGFEGGICIPSRLRMLELALLCMVSGAEFALIVLCLDKKRKDPRGDLIRGLGGILQKTLLLSLLSCAGFYDYLLLLLFADCS